MLKKVKKLPGGVTELRESISTQVAPSELPLERPGDGSASEGIVGGGKVVAVNGHRAVEGEDERSDVEVEPFGIGVSVDDFGWLFICRTASAGVGHGKVGVIDLVAVVDEVGIPTLGSWILPAV